MNRLTPDTSHDSVRALLGDSVDISVTGGPGTGKTTLACEAVVALAGAHGADAVRLVTATRQAATRLRDGLSLGVGVASRGPLARSVSSLAFSVVAEVDKEQPIRLMTGGEQDTIIAELLDGPQSVAWPATLGPEVRALREFRSQLRDVYSRVLDAGMSLDDLIRAGESHPDYVEWVAAGQFLKQYVSSLADTHQSVRDPAETLSVATKYVERGDWAPDFAALVVDDAQDLSASQWRFIQAFREKGVRLIALGNPDQAVGSFRGGNGQLFVELAAIDGRVLESRVLTTNHRHSENVQKLLKTVTEFTGTSGTISHRDISTSIGSTELSVLEATSPLAEHDGIAEFLMSNHANGVPFESMAVVVRSGSDAEGLVSYLVSNGIPASAETSGSPLREHPAVRGLLDLVAVGLGLEPLTDEVAVGLLTNPYGRMDSLAVRKLRRELRSREIDAGNSRKPGELMIQALRTPANARELPDAVGRRLVWCADALEFVRTHSTASIDDILWHLWSTSGREKAWVAESTKSGSIGIAANSSLDAVLSLFSVAAISLEREPDETPAVFVERMREREVPDDTLSPRAISGSVIVATPNAVTGSEFDVVVVSGVITNVWPNMRPRGSLLHSHRIADVVRPVGQGDAPLPVIDDRMTLKHDEIRLFVVAISRARTALLVTTVRSEDEQPSPLFNIVANRQRFVVRNGKSESRADFDHVAVERTAAVASPVSLRHMVASARFELMNPDATTDARDNAAKVLARLAREGVPGADPSEWVGLAAPTVSDPLFDDEPVRLSPSKVSDIKDSPVDWFVDSVRGGRSAYPLSIGNIIHKAFEDMPKSTADEMWTYVESRWDELDFDATWISEQKKREVKGILVGIESYRDSAIAEGRKRIAAEAEFELKLDIDGLDILIRGKVDQIDQLADGSISIVDLKTGSPTESQKKAHTNAQMLTYLLAHRDRAFDDVIGRTNSDIDGARLVYPKEKNKSSEFALRVISAPTPEQLDEFTLDLINCATSIAVSIFAGPEDLDEQKFNFVDRRWFRIGEVSNDE